MLRPGATVERYVVEAMLGQGGIAAVYLVRHSQLDSRHALKVLSFANPDVGERLLMEGRVQATLRHENVVNVTDVLQVQSHPALLMEYIEGPPLDQWLRAHTPTIDESLAVFRGVLAGVGYAHQKGLIHRDLKPGNVLLQVTERAVVPKVADFGLVKGATEGELSNPTRTGATLGTPAYMPPEQIRDASSVDQRADIYSLGCILYQLVCGRAPFVGSDILALFHKIATADYPPPDSLNPDLPAEIVGLITDMLEVDRDKRIATCGAVLERLGPGPSNLDMQTSPGAEVAKTLTTVVAQDPIDSLSTLPVGASISPGETETVVPEVPVPKAPRSLDRPVVGLLLAALLITVSAVGTALYVVNQRPGDAPDPVRSAPVAQPVVAEPEAVDTKPEPVAAEPVAVEPEPVAVEPEPEVVTAPAPVRVVPAPAPRIAPAGPAPASVAFTGARMVVLVSGDTQHMLPADVPAGRYTVRASFADAPVNAGTVVVKAGETVTLQCVANFAQCKRP